MKKIAVLILILTLAFVVRFIYISSYPSGALTHSDEKDFDNIAIGLLQAKGYVDPDSGLPTSLRPPLYAVFLAFIYKVFGHNFFAVRLIQALIDSLTVCLLYLLALKIFNRPTAVLAAIFAAFYMTFIACTGLIYAETLFTFVLVLITSLVIFSKRPGMRRAVELGIFSAILLLIKSSAFFVPFLAIFALAIKMKKGGSPGKKILAAVAVFFLCFSACIMPWTVRNYIIHKKFVLISTNMGINMYPAIRPVEGKIFGLAPRDEIRAKGDMILNEADRNNFYVDESLKAYREDPVRAAWLFMMRFLFFWNVIDWEVMGGAVINYHFIFILPFAILGTMLALKNGRDILFILGICLFFISMVVIFQGTPRYRMPIDGFIIMLGSYGIYEVITRSKDRRVAAIRIGLYLFICYILFRYSAQTKEILKGLMERIGLW